MNTSKTGTIIREHRTVKNMTQKELADKLGVTTFAVSKWENGKSLPDISLLEPISSILDISLDELITGRQPHDSIAENETVKELIAQAVAETKKKVTQRTWHTILILFAVMVISAQLLHLVLISIVDFVPYNLAGSSLTAREESFPLPNVSAGEMYGEVFIKYNGSPLSVSVMPSSPESSSTENELIVFYASSRWNQSMMPKTFDQTCLTTDNGTKASGTSAELKRVYYYNGNDKQLLKILTSHDSTRSNMLDAYLEEHWDAIKEQSVVVFDSDDPEKYYIWDNVISNWTN